MPKPAIDLHELATRGEIHFVGIAGAGMSALAELLMARGARVSGCDARPNAVTQRLAARGATILEGQSADHIRAGISAVITTSAVPLDHPELVAARDAKIPVFKRAQALGALVNRGLVIGIAGTHGKTTTTAMTTSILAEAGLQPTGFVGGRMPGWDSGLFRGGNELFVVEADEYDRSFLTLRPTIAVVTTMEADHLDIYGSVEGVEEAFQQFISKVPAGEGLCVICTDDDGSRGLMRHVPPGVLTLAYGIESNAEFRAHDLETRGRGSRFTVRDGGEALGELTLAVAGHHNVRNALAATAAAMHAGARFEHAQQAMARFTGVERRFEELARVRGIIIVDDYAHHPTEIRATLQAARGAYAGSRLVAVFQPHLYSRTRDFAQDFGAALAGADLVFVTDVYAAREAPIAGVTGELIVAAAERARAKHVHYEPSIDAIGGVIAPQLRTGDVVVFMGAGSIDAAARAFTTQLQGGGA